MQPGDCSHFYVQFNGYNAVAITNILSKSDLGTRPKYTAMETIGYL